MNDINNTNILNSREEIATLDESGVLSSIEALADQVRHAWESTQALDITLDEEIDNVVVAGMGGSALGPDIIKHLFADKLSVPFEIYNSYDLPKYIDDETLVILASYSGTTEETLSCAKQAEEAGSQIMVIAAGGKLAELAIHKGYPLYKIDPVYNPSGQPRTAVGYAVFGLIGLLAKIGLIECTEAELEEVITTIIRTGETLSPETPQEDNRAKLLAFQAIERRPVLVGAEFLAGAMHTAANQFNENAKMYADYKLIPEINHHLMEGLKFPKSNDATHLFLFVHSNLYHPRNQARMKLTQQVVEKNDIETMDVTLQSPTKLTQVFELITLMTYTTFYISMLEGINPGPNPFVDWFKAELGK